MPKDYNLTTAPINQQRRPQNAMDDTWTRDFLLRAEIGHIATLWEDQPFITPTNFWYDPDRQEIYFHGATTGRLHANLNSYPQASFEASQWGKMLPSNIAMGFSIQYESVIAFGKVRILEDPQEKRRVLDALIGKYFPGMRPGEEYRPATTKELDGTAVYALAIESWSGKRNWKDQPKNSLDWKPL
jgi:nitroimidazol reductase NimA-like FMN-containing flavoprotein (pyridoxamine 5'-phosphate oxidase superfamily)